MECQWLGISWLWCIPAGLCAYRVLNGLRSQRQLFVVAAGLVTCDVCKTVPSSAFFPMRERVWVSRKTSPPGTLQISFILSSRDQRLRLEFISTFGPPQNSCQTPNSSWAGQHMGKRKCTLQFTSWGKISPVRQRSFWCRLQPPRKALSAYSVNVRALSASIKLDHACMQVNNHLYWNHHRTRGHRSAHIHVWYA